MSTANQGWLTRHGAKIFDSDPLLVACLIDFLKYGIEKSIANCSLVIKVGNFDWD